ncbi:hypothetical protein V6X63_08735 [Spiribacter sp. 221]|uniref:hypothetical protein n=1 Tax=Spiribacter onubensis TaxID=3122420 RepID=UPI00349F80EE
MLRIATIAMLAVTVVACTTDGVGQYRVESIGNAQRSISGEVIATNPVQIAKNTSGAGGYAGGALGGAMALDNSSDAAPVVAGIIAGAIIGNAIEAQGNVFPGTEYVIETSTGAVLTVAQPNEGNQIFEPGDRVILVYGYPHRLIEDPR